MKIILTACFILLFAPISFLMAQTPGTKWSRPLGGTSADFGKDIQKTSDGGFLFVGTTWSNNKDVSGNHSDSVDLWVVKLNALGQIQWQKCFGGTYEEGFGKLLSNPDGTAILIGTTYSTNGDISGAHGGNDLWVLKIDGQGNILWKKTLESQGMREWLMLSRQMTMAVL